MNLASEDLFAAEEEKSNVVAHLKSSLCLLVYLFFGQLHQGFKALCCAGSSHHDSAVVVGLEGFLIFLRPNETQHGSVQKLILLLENNTR